MLLLPLVLPYDNSIRLAIHFWASSLFPNDRWLSRPLPFPVDWDEDVGIVLKSGFGTRHRLPAWLKAVRGENDILIAADFASRPGEHLRYRNQELPVYDVVGRTLDQVVLPGDQVQLNMKNEKYQNLTAAVNSGDSDLARALSRSFGWELDALKVQKTLEIFEFFFRCRRC